MPIRHSFCYPIFQRGEVGLDALFAAAAEIGYEATEGWGRGDDFDEVVAMAKGHGLRFVSTIGHESLRDGLNRRENHDRIEDELRRSLDVAIRHDIPNLIVFSGRRVEGMSETDAIANCASGLRRVAPQAEEAGINLNLELLNSKVDHPHYQCDHTAWGGAVVDAVASPRVKLLYDVYHMQIMEGDIIRTIRDNAERIAHVHVAGVPGRHEIDDAQELNYRAICRALTETGYDGYVGQEFSPTGDVIAGLRQAFELCRM
jgi:hydroxypyruvate isomerase